MRTYIIILLSLLICNVAEAQTDSDAKANEETSEIIDSLQSRFWEVLRFPNNSGSFDEQVTTDINLASDSVMYVDEDLSAWIKFLIFHSGTFNLKGEGSTIRIPDIFYDKAKWSRASLSVSRVELPDIYTMIDYEKELQNGIPANYTQCLAAATWYDVNKSMIDPKLFYFFYNLSVEKAGSKGTRLFQNMQKIFGRINLSEENINELLSSLFENSQKLANATFSIRQFFHLWPNSESSNLENQLFVEHYYLQYYTLVNSEIDYINYFFSRSSDLPENIREFFIKKRRQPYEDAR